MVSGQFLVLLLPNQRGRFCLFRCTFAHSQHKVENFFANEVVTSRAVGSRGSCFCQFHAPSTLRAVLLVCECVLPRGSTVFLHCSLFHSLSQTRCRTLCFPLFIPSDHLLGNIPHWHRLPFGSSALNFEKRSSTLRRCLPPAPPDSPAPFSFGFAARRPCLPARHAARLPSNSRRPLHQQLLAVKTLTGALGAGSDKREDLTVVCLQGTKHNSGDKGTQPLGLTGIAKM